MSSWRPAWHGFSCLHEDHVRILRFKIFSLTQESTMVLWRFKLYYPSKIPFQCLVRHARECLNGHMYDLMSSHSLVLVLYMWFWHYSHHSTPSDPEYVSISMWLGPSHCEIDILTLILLDNQRNWYRVKNCKTQIKQPCLCLSYIWRRGIQRHTTTRTRNIIT